MYTHPPSPVGSVTLRLTGSPGTTTPPYDDSVIPSLAVAVHVTACPSADKVRLPRMEAPRSSRRGTLSTGSAGVLADGDGAGAGGTGADGLGVPEGAGLADAAAIEGRGDGLYARDGTGGTRTAESGAITCAPLAAAGAEATIRTEDSSCIAAIPPVTVTAATPAATAALTAVAGMPGTGLRCFL